MKGNEWLLLGNSFFRVAGNIETLSGHCSYDLNWIHATVIQTSGSPNEYHKTIRVGRKP